MAMEKTDIVKVEVGFWSRPLVQGMDISRGGFKTRSHVFLRLTDADGIRGYGEGVGNTKKIHAALTHATDWNQIAALAGVWDGTKRDGLFPHEVYFEKIGTSWAAESAIEMAILDLLARKAQVPAHVLLGRGKTPRLMTYASNVYWDTPDKMAAVASEIVAAGVNAVKIHIGREEPEAEIDRIASVRNAIGPKRSLMVDLNAGYTEAQALRAIQLWQGFDLFWLEEPLNPSDFRGLARLADSTAIPIAVGENLGSREEFVSAADSGASVLMPDIGRIGFDRTRTVGALCEEYGLDLSPHNFASGILVGATVSLLSAQPRPGLLELDLSKNALYEEIFGPITPAEDGSIKVSDQPGLGIMEDSEWESQITWTLGFQERAGWTSPKI